MMPHQVTEMQKLQPALGGELLSDVLAVQEARSGLVAPALPLWVTRWDKAGGDGREAAWQEAGLVPLETLEQPGDPLRANSFLAPYADLLTKSESNPGAKSEGGRRRKRPWSNLKPQGPPRAELQDEGGKTTPEPYEVVRQIVEELRRAHGTEQEAVQSAAAERGHSISGPVSARDPVAMQGTDMPVLSQPGEALHGRVYAFYPVDSGADKERSSSTSRAQGAARFNSPQGKMRRIYGLIISIVLISVLLLVFCCWMYLRRSRKLQQIAWDPEAGPCDQAAGPSPFGAGPSDPSPLGAGPSNPSPLGAGLSTPSPLGAGPSTPSPLGAGLSTPSPSGAGPSNPSPLGDRPSNPSLLGAGSSTPSFLGAGPSTPSLLGAGPSTPSLLGAGSSNSSTFRFRPSTPSLLGAGSSNPSTFRFRPSNPSPRRAGPSKSSLWTSGVPKQPRRKARLSKQLRRRAVQSNSLPLMRGLSIPSPP